MLAVIDCGNPDRVVAFQGCNHFRNRTTGIGSAYVANRLVLEIGYSRIFRGICDLQYIGAAIARDAEIRIPLAAESRNPALNAEFARQDRYRPGFRETRRRRHEDFERIVFHGSERGQLIAGQGTRHAQGLQR